MNYKYWLEENLDNLNIDFVGQINFIGTKFEYDQNARLKIQAMFDQEHWRKEK